MTGHRSIHLSGRRWASRGYGPVGLKVPLLGSYTSAEARVLVPPSTIPPAIRTRPSASRVAVARLRAVAIEPVGLNAPCRRIVQLGRGIATGDEDPAVVEQRRQVCRPARSSSSPWG